MYNQALFWKVELFLIDQVSLKSIGMASLLLRKNSLPSGGHCFVSSDYYNLVPEMYYYYFYYVEEYYGQSLQSLFSITCSDWYDSDGYIATYEFMS